MTTPISHRIGTHLRGWRKSTLFLGDFIIDITWPSRRVLRQAQGDVQWVGTILKFSNDEMRQFEMHYIKSPCCFFKSFFIYLQRLILLF